MGKIKAIIFDLGGVVFSSDGGTYEARERLAGEIGVDAKKLHDIWFRRREDLIKGKGLEDDYINEIVSLGINLTAEELKNKIRSYNDVDQKILDFVKELSKKYKVAVLNNEVKEWNIYRINTFNIKDYFEIIVSSCDVGYAKPEREIYEIVLERLGVKAEEAIFIDDRMGNISGAEKLGIKSILFEDREQMIEDLEKEGVVV